MKNNFKKPFNYYL